MQNNVISIRITCLYGSQPSSVIFACKTATFVSELQVSMLSQTSPMFFCKQNIVISIRITIVYGSHRLSVVFACKTATFGSELQVSMGPILPLLVCECKTACLDPEWRLSIGLSLHLWFCAFKTATLASELLVSIGPSFHLWCCAFLTAPLASESLVSTGPSPHLWLLCAKSDFRTRITSLYGSQTSPMVFCIQNGVFSTRIASLYGSQPSSVDLCSQTASLPKDWTCSNVPPVFKKGSRHSPSNYRPISLTCLLLKTMERLISKRVSTFLTSHKLLSPFQHGFRQGHSCQTQLLESVHQWAESLNRNSSSHVIFLEFSRAFYSVPHQRLLLKLDRIGIRGQLLRWIEAFLLNRQQRVVIDGHASEWAAATSGVPQGSILGPLRFLICVDDIGSDIASQTRLFADDCTVYREVNGKTDMQALQTDLNHLYQWSQTWQLSLNLSKCKAICISNKRSPPLSPYYINNVPLDWVETHSSTWVLPSTGS